MTRKDIYVFKAKFGVGNFEIEVYKLPVKKETAKRQRTGRREQNVAKTAEILYHQSVKIVVVTLGGMEHIFTAAGRTGSVCPFWKRRCKPLCGEKRC